MSGTNDVIANNPENENNHYAIEIVVRRFIV
jgi:hypothetical protein